MEGERRATCVAVGCCIFIWQASVYLLFVSAVRETHSLVVQYRPITSLHDTMAARAFSLIDSYCASCAVADCSRPSYSLISFCLYIYETPTIFASPQVNIYIIQQTTLNFFPFFFFLIHQLPSVSIWNVRRSWLEQILYSPCNISIDYIRVWGTQKSWKSCCFFFYFFFVELLHHHHRWIHDGIPLMKNKEKKKQTKQRYSTSIQLSLFFFSLFVMVWLLWKDQYVLVRSLAWWLSFFPFISFSYYIYCPNSSSSYIQQGP